MDFYNDQSFQAYLGAMNVSPPAKNSAFSEYRRSSAVAETITEGMFAAEASGDSFYNAIERIVREEGYEPSEAGAPFANFGGGDDGKKKKKGGKKRKRDPNKPKGWISGILMYSNAHRPRVKAENPGATFGDIGRLVAAEFRRLSPRDAAHWEKKFAEDRMRYKREMLAYAPPSAVNIGDSSKAGVEGTITEKPQSKEPMVTTPEGEGSKDAFDLLIELKAKKPKRKKDPNAPKKNRSAWHFFCSVDARKHVMIENPGGSHKAMMEILSRRYRALSESQRGPLDSMAAADKVRYEREMTEYERTQ